MITTFISLFILVMVFLLVSIIYNLQALYNNDDNDVKFQLIIIAITMNTVLHVFTM